ncbi:acyltransferase [Pseudomonas alliivorans]|nr:acyltransferase [Pseudomonas alliivorans]MEE4710173.1 acyltransferase [Pseudomonas alliivorans]MEE4725220.1 acyltransferase [Pseudomonas alliivorans]MEE4765919.1 acyltransferase [Pseudomonas alliivorans]
MNQVRRKRLDGIESLRAYAAVSIVLFHLAHSGGALLPESLGFISSHFGMGVPLFFVLSGFSMAYGYFGRLSGDSVMRGYFVRRFARIAPFFYVMIVFQLAVLYFVNGITHSPLDVLLHATFVFNFIPHLTEGIVPASWTIGVEMVFYALFPLFIMLCTNIWRSAAAVAISTIVATKFNIDVRPFENQISSFLYHNFVVQLPYFLWGILFFHIQQAIVARLEERHHRHLCWALIAFGFFGVWHLYANSAMFIFFAAQGLRTTWDTLWSIPLGSICLAMALHPSRILSNRVTQYLGKISFSLYLVHPTVLYGFGQAGVYKWIYALVPSSLAAGYALAFALSLGVIAAISAVTYRFIEVPGMNWGKRMATRQSPVAAQAA